MSRSSPGPIANCSGAGENPTHRREGHTGKPEDLSRGGVSTVHLNLLGADSEGLGDELADGRVGRALFGCGGDADFELAVELSDDPVAGGFRHDFDRQQHVPVMDGQFDGHRCIL